MTSSETMAGEESGQLLQIPVVRSEAMYQNDSGLADVPWGKLLIAGLTISGPARIDLPPSCPKTRTALMEHAAESGHPRVPLRGHRRTGQSAHIGCFR